MHGKGLHLRAKQAMVPFHGHYSILQMNVPLITRPTSECHPLYFSSKKANNRTSSQPRIHYIFHINSHGYKIHSFTSFSKIYNQYYCIAKGITRASRWLLTYLAHTITLSAASIHYFHWIWQRSLTLTWCINRLTCVSADVGGGSIQPTWATHTLVFTWTRMHMQPLYNHHKL